MKEVGGEVDGLSSDRIECVKNVGVHVS